MVVVPGPVQGFFLLEGGFPACLGVRLWVSVEHG